jgi:hypothetical protein
VPKQVIVHLTDGRTINYGLSYRLGTTTGVVGPVAHLQGPRGWFGLNMSNVASIETRPTRPT